jgi:hypothetical protein
LSAVFVPGNKCKFPSANNARLRTVIVSRVLLCLIVQTFALMFDSKWPTKALSRVAIAAAERACWLGLMLSAKFVAFVDRARNIAEQSRPQVFVPEEGGAVNFRPHTTHAFSMA